MEGINIAIIIGLVILLVLYLRYYYEYSAIADHTLLDPIVLETLNNASELEAKRLCNRRTNCDGVMEKGKGYVLLSGGGKLKYEPDSVAIRRRHIMQMPDVLTQDRDSFTQTDAAVNHKLTMKRNTMIQPNGPSHSVTTDGVVLTEGFTPSKILDTTDPLFRYNNGGGPASGLNELDGFGGVFEGETSYLRSNNEVFGT